MKRKLVNLGIFDRAVCAGDGIRGPEQRDIYDALKSVGFRETKWQLIYDGQTGGLVCPYRDGLNEIHVRFYDDRIFAELEFSRSSIFHFALPLYNANAYVVRLLEGRISTEARACLTEMTSRGFRDDEASCPMWNSELLVNPYLGDRSRLLSRTVLLLHRAFGWRWMAGAAALAALFAPQGVASGSVVCMLLALLLVLIAPGVGKP